MQKKYIVRLTDEERGELREVIGKLKGTGQKVRRAQILLKADADGPNWTDQKIAEAFSCRVQTIEKIRQRLVERGFHETLNGAKRERPPVEKLVSVQRNEVRIGEGKVILVSDNLNTHTKGAFYEAFEPERARRLVRRIEFHHTPKHGSWLNIAENELRSLTRQCVSGRRFADIPALQEEASAWSTDVNSTQRGVDWQMKIDDTRCKLKSTAYVLQVRPGGTFDNSPAIYRWDPNPQKVPLSCRDN